MSAKVKIVGIGGMPRSGKDSLADLFIQAGYFGVSFGDIVRGYARDRHKDKTDPISVANMTDTSNWLRETRGPDVILQEALRQYEARQAAGKDDKGLVLYSVRAPVEVDFILSHGGELVWVEASDTVRHARAQKHLRKGELEQPLEQFKAQEALQWQPQPGVPKEVQMDISYVRTKATRELVNNGDDFETYLKQAKELINEIQADE